MTKKNNNILIATLFLVITIDTMGVGIVWPLFGTLFTGKESTLFSSSTSMELRNILYGITIGIASLFAFFSAPIIGDLSDQIGRRKVLIYCLIFTAIGMMISTTGIILNTVILLIISRAWIGATTASQAIAQASIIDISNYNNKANRIGIISAANNIGYIFGPIAGSALANKNLVSWFDFTTPFCFSAIMALLGALLLFKIYKAPPPLKNQPKKTDKNRFKKIFIFARAFTNKNIRTPAILYLLLQLGWAFYLQTNFLSLIQNHNYNTTTLGYYLTWLGILFCFNLLLSVRIISRYMSLKTIICTSLCTASICCLTNSFYNSEFSIWLNLLFMATSIALGANGILTALSNTAKENEQGWMMGVGGSLSSLAWATVPPLTGVLLSVSFNLPLIIATVLFFIATLIGFLNLKRVGS